MPPAGGPTAGLTPVTVGALLSAMKVNPSAELTGLVPLGPTIVTSTRPAVWAGLCTVIVLSFTTLSAVPLVAPNLTEVAPVKLLPVRVTVVPPWLVPEDGVSPVRAGSGS